MNKELEKRLQQYQSVLKRDRVLSAVSEKLYQEEGEETPRTVTTLFVMAPVLCRFVLWVLKEAVKTGKKRLYFLARDGYSMYQVAQTICEEIGLEIECRYLYCSRYAWRSAEYKLLQKESLSYICMGGIDVTFEKLMYRAGLTLEEAKEVAAKLKVEDRWQVELSYSEIKTMIPILSNCPLFLEKMKAHAEEKYPNVCGYLEQEGLLEDIPYAIVDSGWTGSMQKSLNRLLSEKGFAGRLEGYYFGMYEYPQDADRTAYHTWYFKPEEIRRKVYFCNSLFECVFSSPEGMTVGYEKKENEYVPILEHQKNPNRDRIEDSTNRLKRYAQTLAREYGQLLFALPDDFQNTAAALLYYFMGRPTIEEAAEYGSYIFCDDVIGEKEQKVAAELTHQELKENGLLCKGRNMLLKKEKPIRESAWIEGSTVLKEGKSGKGLRRCAFYKYVLYFRKRLK